MFKGKKIRNCLCMLTLAFSTTNFAADLVISSKNFTEQRILAEITDKYLTKKGFDIDQKDSLASNILRKAQLNGQIDMYWEYTGTSLLTYNKITDTLTPEETYFRVKDVDAEQGLVWLDPSKASNNYALAMNTDEAEEKGISSISDLASHINNNKDMVFGTNAEFVARADGLAPLQKAYDFKLSRADIKTMDIGLSYQALKENQVNFASVFSTDGRITAFNLLVLEDNKNFFPDYALVPVIRKDAMERSPAVVEHLNTLSSKLTSEIMTDLNARVGVEKQSITDVADYFLTSQGLM